jgi:hypothetical protein
MRIVIVSPFQFHVTGGVATVVQQLSRTLRA